MFKKVGNILLSWLTLIATGICVYYAVRYDAHWAKNLVAFVAWLLFIGTIITLFAKKPKSSGTIPKWIGVTFHTAIVIVLVAKGWFLLGTLWLISIILNQAKKGK
jgi:hypothetical protein